MNKIKSLAYYYTADSGWLTAIAALIFLVLLVVLPLLAIVNHAEHIAVAAFIKNRYIQNVVWFSIWQAGLSSLLAIGLAIPVAFSIARQAQFPGRSHLIRLFSISLVIPSVVAVFGLIAVFGNNGWLNKLLSFGGFTNQISIYGITGILLAHIFFNLPLSARIMLQTLERIPSENWRLASQLGMNSFDCFRLVQWPILRKILPSVILLVFSLCFTSFTIVMTLGGGPAATTIEVAIYQALRFDFDLDYAVGLASIQIIICLLLILMTARFGKINLDNAQSNGTLFIRQDGGSYGARVFDSLIIFLALGLICMPLLAIIFSGLSPSLFSVIYDSNFWQAARNTLSVSITAGSLSVLLAFALLRASVHLRIRMNKHLPGKLLELSGSLILVIPPLVLGTGLFLLLRDITNVFAMALGLTVLVNALMGLPFSIRILEQPMLQTTLHHDRLCAAQGIFGMTRFRIIDWPLLRKPVGLAMAVSSTLAAGDLTVIALFGSQDIKTLPLYLYQLMGSYRLEQAAATAMLLLLYCLLLFWLIESMVGGRQGVSSVKT